VSTYVQPQSLQEAGVSPTAFIQRVKKAGVDAAIVALRFSQVRGQPSATGYIRAFQQAGWKIAGHAVLGQAQTLPGLSGIAILNAPNLPSNEVARQIRGNWGFV
jgi:hypothetical protein